MWCALHCAEKNSLCMFACVSRKGGTGGGAWDHLQGAVHWAAARLDWPWLTPGGPIFTLATERYCHLVGGSFLAGKAFLVLNWYLPDESADYCMLEVTFVLKVQLALNLFHSISDHKCPSLHSIRIHFSKHEISEPFWLWHFNSNAMTRARARAHTHTHTHTHSGGPNDPG